MLSTHIYYISSIPIGPLRDVRDISTIGSADSVRPISMTDFDRALMLARASVDQKDLKALEEWNDLFGSFPLNPTESTVTTPPADTSAGAGNEVW